MANIGENVERVTNFIFLDSKITGDGDLSPEIKRHLFLGRKPTTNLDSTLKRREITLPTKVCIVKVMVFPAVMYGCESWTIKKAEHCGIDAFELWCWRRRLDYKEIKPVHPKGNQFWIFTERTDVEAEAPVLWPPDAKSKHIAKDLDAEKDRRQRRMGQQRMRWLESITDSMDMNLRKLQGIVEDRGDWCVAVHEVTKSQTRLSD